MTTVLYCTEPYISTAWLSRYDLNLVESEVKHQIIISQIIYYLPEEILDPWLSKVLVVKTDQTVD